MKFLNFLKDLYNRKKLIRLHKPWSIRSYDLRREIALFWDTPVNKNKLKQGNTDIYDTLVSLSSFGGRSGSVAIGDFLCEFDKTTVLGGAYLNNKNKNRYACNFWIENNSVLSLEDNIFSKKFFYSNLAALNFSLYVLRNYYSSIPIYDDYYLERSKEFLFDLIEFHWRYTYGSYQSKLDYEYEYTPPKIPNRIEIANAQAPQIVENAWKNMSLKEYRQKAKIYMQDILKNIPSNKILVCPQLLNLGVFDAELFEDYFGDIKMIYVWRDPRDQYVGNRNRFRSYVPKDPLIFSKRFAKLANSILKAKHPNLLVIRFEDFVLKYDKTSTEIMNFLGLDPVSHTKKFKYFNPNISASKIGVFKNYSDQEAIKIIESELKEYCYEN